MCKIIEDMCKDMKEETEKKTIIKTALNCAINLLDIGKLTYAEIASATTCMDAEDVKTLDNILKSPDSENDIQCFAEELMKGKKANYV